MARRKLGIRTRATVASALALGLSAAAFAVAFGAVEQGQADSSRLAHQLVPASAAADDLVSMLTSQQNRLRNAVTEGRPDGLALADAAGTSARAAAARVATHSRGDPAMTARLGDLS